MGQEITVSQKCPYKTDRCHLETHCNDSSRTHALKKGKKLATNEPEPAMSLKMRAEIRNETIKDSGTYKPIYSLSRQFWL